MLDDIEDIKLKEYEKHDIDLVIDRLDAKNIEQKRLTDAIELATVQSKGEVKVLIEGEEPLFFSENNACPTCGISYPKIVPASFSFNALEGACSNCAGLGILKELDINLLYNPNLTISEGGIFPWSNRTSKDSWTLKILQSVATEHTFDLKTPIKKYPQEIFDLIFYGKGTKPTYTIEYTNRFGRTRVYETPYEGVINELNRRYKETSSDYSRLETEKYMVEKECETCHGKRLKPYSLAVTIKEKNIDEVTNTPIKELIAFFESLELKGNKAEIAKPIVKEILSRLTFLTNVGLDYLTLSRKANTLSGGESQRIRLASQIGTGLTGVLYVLDEPSIGLHQRDVSKLIKSLENLRDTGNSVIVVEHDEETIRCADWVVDIGPNAGKHGGKVVAEGTMNDIKHSDSLTAKYLNKELSVGQRIKKNKNIGTKDTLKLTGLTTHNLKAVSYTHLTLPTN
jgi:excinuclease ABC subunit A